MTKSDYSIEVLRFLNYLKIRETQRNSEEFDTPNIFNTAITDYAYELWFKLSCFLFFIIFAFGLFIYLFDYNSDLGFYIAAEIVCISIGVYYVYFPQFTPRPVCFTKIKSRIKSLDRSILNTNKIDFELITDILRAKPNEEELSLAKLLYNRIPIEDLKDNNEKLKNLEKLIGFYYFSKINLSTRKKDEEIVYLVASLLKIGKGSITNRLITPLLKLQDIDDIKSSFKDFEDIRPILGTTLKYLEEVKKHIELDINIIENLKEVKK